MTDIDPGANGQTPGATSAPRDVSTLNELPEAHETAERGGEPGYQAPAPPGFGSVSARPDWPGVARPAGWFLSAPREAAPLDEPSSGPARPDTRMPGDVPDSLPGLRPGHESLAWLAAGESPDPGQAWRFPVVGPTEALRGRAGGPGFRVPRDLAPGPHDQDNRSAWQIARGVWQGSGSG